MQWRKTYKIITTILVLAVSTLASASHDRPSSALPPQKLGWSCFYEYIKNGTEDTIYLNPVSLTGAGVLGNPKDAIFIPIYPGATRCIGVGYESRVGYNCDVEYGMNLKSGIQPKGKLFSMHILDFTSMDHYST